MVGAKDDGAHVFAKHPRFFAGALILLAVLIFVGSGGLGIVNISPIILTDPLVAILFFLIVMVASVWILMKESGEK